ncbi:hypothetical protein [Saccharothrix carnea]|uniref:hypothetical protein n=1 Tax=Saccharothrix carnea TaxID=1280637 RepID=UPI0011B26877|nr:hypothetical protein [Saccharothrix carnea]
MSPEPSVVQPTAAGTTAAELVESVPQLDDSGANTADRYDWQAAMATADGLAMFYDALGDDGRLRPECQDKIVCEWQEDWVLYSGEDVELVSGKHRDPSAGAYTTVNKLAGDGGLAHLFNRWAAMNETPLCRLVTSGGVGNGPPQHVLAAAEHFRSMRSATGTVTVNSEHADIVTDLRNAIAGYSDDTRTRWEGTDSVPALAERDRDAEVARFLAALTITDKQVQRDHVGFAAPSMYIDPVLERMGVANGPAAAVWEAVLTVFRVRMKARGRLPYGGLPLVLRRGSDTSAIPPETRRTLAARTVTMGDIGTAIATALAVPGGFKPVPRMPLTSRLAVKMNVGGCSDNAVERALSLRLDYQDYWSERESGEATARVERKRFERLLQRISDHATESVQPDGALLWRRLQTEVDAVEQDSMPAGMEADVALGGVCDLAGQCKVWFGPRFDVDAVIEDIRMAQEAGS